MRDWKSEIYSMLTTNNSSIPLIICPGFHDSAWTDAFLQGVELPKTHPTRIFPIKLSPACSGGDIVSFLHRLADGGGRSFTSNKSVVKNDTLETAPILIGFSAGVLGAMQAAWAWQHLGGQIAAIIAIDGWGVPLISGIPCYRLSHDFFTHWSSALFGIGCDSFYARPSVTHSELWQYPHQVKGQWINHGEEAKSPITAATFIRQIVSRHAVGIPLVRE